MDQLTPIQERILAAIRGEVTRGRSAPSYRSLCTEFGWRSTGTVRDHLRALARKGYVDLPKGRGGRVALRKGIAPVSNVPVLGRIEAGMPTAAQQTIEGFLPVPASWARDANHFALKVKGDSMIGAGIFDGDYVVIRGQPTAHPGDIVAVTIDGETTLKRLAKARHRVMLIPENPRFRPIQVNSDSLVVHGVLVGLLRSYG
jgi:repressor LexA